MDLDATLSNISEDSLETQTDWNVHDNYRKATANTLEAKTKYSTAMTQPGNDPMWNSTMRDMHSDHSESPRGVSETDQNAPMDLGLWGERLVDTMVGPDAFANIDMILRQPDRTRFKRDSFCQEAGPDETIDEKAGQAEAMPTFGRVFAQLEPASIPKEILPGAPQSAFNQGTWPTNRIEPALLPVGEQTASPSFIPLNTPTSAEAQPFLTQSDNFLAPVQTTSLDFAVQPPQEQQIIIGIQPNEANIKPGDTFIQIGPEWKIPFPIEVVSMENANGNEVKPANRLRSSVPAATLPNPAPVHPSTSAFTPPLVQEEVVIGPCPTPDKMEVKITSKTASSLPPARPYQRQDSRTRRSKGYREKRAKNNISVRKSRAKKAEANKALTDKVAEQEKEILELRARVKQLEAILAERHEKGNVRIQQLEKLNAELSLMVATKDKQLCEIIKSAGGKFVVRVN